MPCSRLLGHTILGLENDCSGGRSTAVSEGIYSWRHIEHDRHWDVGPALRKALEEQKHQLVYFHPQALGARPEGWRPHVEKFANGVMSRTPPPPPPPRHAAKAMSALRIHRPSIKAASLVAISHIVSNVKRHGGELLPGEVIVQRGGWHNLQNLSSTRHAEGRVHASSRASRIRQAVRELSSAAAWMELQKAARLEGVVSCSASQQKSGQADSPTHWVAIGDVKYAASRPSCIASGACSQAWG